MSENTTPGDGKCNSDLPPPPVHAGADLRGIKWVSIRSSLRDDWSAHNAATWRALISMDLAAWQQVPAGSLPACAKMCGNLTNFGRNFGIFLTIFCHPERYGWYKCSDGRMYHKCLADRVLHELKRNEKRQAQRRRDIKRNWQSCGRKEEEGRKEGIPPPSPPPESPAMGSDGGDGGGARPRPRVRAWDAGGMRTATSLPDLLRAAGTPCNASMVSEWSLCADGFKLDDLSIILWHSIMNRDPIRLPSGLRAAINAFRAMDSTERSAIKAAAAAAGVV